MTMDGTSRIRLGRHGMRCLARTGAHQRTLACQSMDTLNLDAGGDGHERTSVLSLRALRRHAPTHRQTGTFFPHVASAAALVPKMGAGMARTLPRALARTLARELTRAHRQSRGSLGPRTSGPDTNTRGGVLRLLTLLEASRQWTRYQMGTVLLDVAHCSTTCVHSAVVVSE